MSRCDAAALAAMLAAAAVCLTHLGGAVGLSEHECLVAETAREMRATSDWIVPHFAGEPRVRKTPLAYWCVAGLSLLTGRVDEFTARLPSAISAIGVVACVWAMARRLGGPRTGAVAAWVSGTSAGLLFYAHQAVVDLPQTFCCALCYLLFFRWLDLRHAPPGRRRAYLFYIALGVAMLAKFPVAGVVVVAPLGLYAAIMLLARRWTWRDVRALHPIEGTLIVLLIAAPWFVAVWARVPGYFAVWKAETVDRFSGELRSDQTRWFSEPWYYLPVLFVVCLPWSLSLPQALALPLRRGPAQRREPLRIIGLWFAVTFAALTVVGFKRDHYLLPALPAACLLLAVTVEEFFLADRPRDPRRARLGAAVLLLSVAAVVVGAVFVVKARAPAMLEPIRRAAPVAFVGIVLAAGLYVAGRRVASLAATGAASLAAFVLVWPGLRPQFDVQPVAAQLRAAIDRHKPASQEIRWVGPRRAQFVYYGPLPYARFEDPQWLLDAAERARSEMADMKSLVGQRLCARLRAPQPIWLIMNEDSFSLFRRFFNAPVFLVATVWPPAATKLGPLVLVTNVRPAAQPTTFPQP